MKTIATAFLFMVSVCALANAQTISVNIAEDDMGVPRANQTILPTDVAGATGFEAVNWNNALISPGGLGGLVDDSAAVTTASVTWGANNGWGDASANDDADAGVPNAKLQRGYLDDNGPGNTATVNIDDIPFPRYDLVLYLSSDSPGLTHGEFSVNGTDFGNAGLIINWEDQPTVDVGRNVFVVPNLTSSSLDVVGTRTFPPVDPLTRGSISGFQIVRVPEPASLVLVAVLALGFLCFRRR